MLSVTFSLTKMWVEILQVKVKRFTDFECDDNNSNNKKIKNCIIGMSTKMEGGKEVYREKN